MDTDLTLRLPSGRTVGFATFGDPNHTAVIWCHGGPGSRLDPGYLAAAAFASGLRLIGIDRPGYGLSDPDVGRSISGWIPEALAVADALDIARFVTVGLSTGGAFALALAALAPERVLGVVPCCAMTDMRFEPARLTMSVPHAIAVWDALDRDGAMAAAVASHGIDGSRIIDTSDGPPLAESDLAMMYGAWGRHVLETLPTMFAHGVEGYTDDRIADGPGWVTFDVADVRCPVIVLHGAADIITDPIHARHTAEIVPGAELRVIDGLGHFSIEDELVPAIRDLLSAEGGARFG